MSRALSRQLKNSMFLLDGRRFLSGSSEKNRIVQSPCTDIPLPETSLYSHVFQHFPKYGEKIALVDGITGREYSYNELQESVVNMASGLVRGGMKKGDVLSLVSPNSAQFCLTLLSTVAIGGIVSTCNPQFTAQELAYQFKHSNSKYVATTTACLPTLKEAITMSGCVEKIIVLDDKGGFGEGKHMIAYQKLMEDNGSCFSVHINIVPKLDIALIPFSSGTTGPPKGVKLTHQNLSTNIMQLTCLPEITGDFYHSGNLIAVLPFFHGSGLLLTMLAGLHKGSTIIVMPKFVPELFLSLIETYEVTSVNVVPPLLLFLVNHPMVEEYNISSLKHITYSAAPMDGETATKVKQRLDLQHLRQCFGMTEACVTHFTPFNVFKPQSIGVPLPHINCKVVDIDTGAAVAPECQGELLVQGPQMMKGYLNDPMATDATIKNGWLHTGDLGHYDQDGYFYVTDRLKELIKVKGFQVAPAELEALLLQHSHISDAAVIGVDDERSGELPQAFVVRNSNDLTEQQVEKYVKERVVEYKQLKGGVKFIKEIPRSPSGKILRRLLRQN